MYVISPWSRGGWVNSEVFDHTSVLRFLEARFGVSEPNITPWRRAVCGDLTSCFDFKTPNVATFHKALPETAALSAKATPLKHVIPPTPILLKPPVQAEGVRPSRPLPYQLEASMSAASDPLKLTLENRGQAGAVLHVYDRGHLDAIPHRYTLEAETTLDAEWAAKGGYDLWVLGPNGFHRHFMGRTDHMALQTTARFDLRKRMLRLKIYNPGDRPVSLTVSPMAYSGAHRSETITLGAGRHAEPSWPLDVTYGWYDLVVRQSDDPSFLRRLAGRMETGKPSVTDPAMGGPALMSHLL